MSFEIREPVLVTGDEVPGRAAPRAASPDSPSRTERRIERPHRILRRVPRTPAEELWRMSSGSQGSDPQASAPDCVQETWAGLAHASEGSVWESVAASHADARGRLGQIARTLESVVIPRLVQTLGEAEPEPRQRRHGEHGPLGLTDVDRFVQTVLDGSDAEVTAAVRRWHRLAGSVTSVYLDLLGPAARRLGQMWEEDRCDFASVTIALGRLQHLLRMWSPSFGREVPHVANDRRILFAQHPQEQHRFGIAMVADFFRRAGWEVLGGPGGDGMAEPDMDQALRSEWFDAVGFSVGAESRLDWIAVRVAQVRRLSRNRGVVILVGGPLAVVNPDCVARLGADAVGNDGARAPEQAERLLASRAALG
jgi:methanogenic corrinoid protein MtbC1